MIDLNEFRITFDVYKSNNTYPETHYILMTARKLEDIKEVRVS